MAQRGLTVDVLVNNAGLSTTGAVAKSEVEAELRMIRTDVEAVAHLCSAFLPGMVERGRGAVLNVASTAAFQPLPGQAGYSASKAGIDGLDKGRDVVIPGAGNRLLAGFAQHAPRRLLLPILAKQHPSLKS